MDVLISGGLEAASASALAAKALRVADVERLEHIVGLAFGVTSAAAVATEAGAGGEVGAGGEADVPLFFVDTAGDDVEGIEDDDGDADDVTVKPSRSKVRRVAAAAAAARDDDGDDDDE